MVAFLEETAYQLNASQAELASWILSLSQGMTADDLGARMLAVLP